MTADPAASVRQGRTVSRGRPERLGESESLHAPVPHFRVLVKRGDPNERLF